VNVCSPFVVFYYSIFSCPLFGVPILMLPWSGINFLCLVDIHLLKIMILSAVYLQTVVFLTRKATLFNNKTRIKVQPQDTLESKINPCNKIYCSTSGQRHSVLYGWMRSLNAPGFLAWLSISVEFKINQLSPK
jgi:hypothetical protein